jgi:hypothetical protein
MQVGQTAESTMIMGIVPELPGFPSFSVSTEIAQVVSVAGKR